MGKFEFGSCPAGQVEAYTITNGNGLEATIVTLGAAVQSLKFQGTDVVFGYDNAQGYYDGVNYFGATVGRNANRIANAKFTLNGTDYQLTANEGKNQLHGGIGFDKKIWKVVSSGLDTVCMQLVSSDGEAGYPGTMVATVMYRAEQDNSLSMSYLAEADKDTVANFTNHCFYNLNGGGSIADHTLQILADRYTEVGEGLIPTGRNLPVEGTELDFRQPKKLGDTLHIDHNFCLEGQGMRKVACLAGDEIAVDVITDQPGLQIYCDFFKEPRFGKDGARYEGRCFCTLETQGYPDAVNHPDFPSVILPAGKTYQTTTIYRFRSLK